MAITEIHPIRKTPEKALAYTMADKIEEYTPGMEIDPDISYRIFEENGKQYIRYLTLNAMHECLTTNPMKDFDRLQQEHQNNRYYNGNRSKEKGEIVMYHMVQSFAGMEVPAHIASDIGYELACEVFSGHAVMISTHTNTANIHNHYIISAWNRDGRKLVDDHALLQKIRETSDKLCEKYGLSVLEETRRMKLIKYTDKHGKTRFFEPTSRKHELIEKRKAAEISSDDVNSYRNTEAYQKKHKKKLTNREAIKNDIDNLLPGCKHYAELLDRLREMGYIVQTLNKDGTPRKHVTFQAPLQDKATREDKIGDGYFYVKANLIEYIAAHAPQKEKPDLRTFDSNLQERKILYFDKNEYGTTNLVDIDDDYKAAEFKGGNIWTGLRTAAEVRVLKDIRARDAEVRGLIDTTGLNRIIEEQKMAQQQKKPCPAETQEQILVAQIQSGLRCLHYIERHDIYSYEQIITLYTANKHKYDSTLENFNRANELIMRLKEALSLPQKSAELQARIESRKSDIGYILEDYSRDSKLLRQYNDQLTRYKLETPQGVQALRAKVEEFDRKQARIEHYLNTVTTTLNELENCIRTFDRIDREHGKGNTEAMRAFEALSGHRCTQHEKTATKHKNERESR